MLSLFSKKNIWKLLLIIPFSLSTFFALKTFFSFIEYKSLSATTWANHSLWSVTLHKGRYHLKASYSFELEGKSYENITLIQNPSFPNPYAAEITLASCNKSSWMVFYNPNNPFKNSLEKVFPFSSFIYFLLSLTVSLYFLILKKFLDHRALVDG